MSQNPELTMTLNEAVDEVLALLSGLDLHYGLDLDRYRVVARQLNRGLRSVALEREWSYYSSIEDAGVASLGQTGLELRSSVRPRVIRDDAVRLVDGNGVPRVWAYFLPRDAISKYPAREGLWVATTRTSLTFSRPIGRSEAGLSIHVPVMREPRAFVIPHSPDSNIPDDSGMTQAEIGDQLLDFSYPDLVVLRAAFLYAQTDPVLQPRVQTLEAQYKDLMYQVVERDDRNTDSPYLNEFFVPIDNGLVESFSRHPHPHSDERR